MFEWCNLRLNKEFQILATSGNIKINNNHETWSQKGFKDILKIIFQRPRLDSTLVKLWVQGVSKLESVGGHCHFQ